MKITRFDSDRSWNREVVDVIEISITDKHGAEVVYRLTEEHKELKIHNKHGYINISPCCANEIRLQNN